MDIVIDNNNGSFYRRQGIDNAYEVLEATMETARIQGRRQRLRRCDDTPEELGTMTDVSEEEDEPEVSTKAIEALEEKADDIMRPSKYL